MEKKKALSVKEQQVILLEIMKDIDKFCRANGIPYTISSGTLLGAVRHGGFIPWDDDADMFMLRKDFDRFVKIYKSDKYKLIFNFNPEEKKMASGYAKIGDVSTYTKDSTGVLEFGVSVDVFPLESVPEDPDECKKYVHKIMSINNRLYHRRRKDLLSILKSYRHSFAWWWNKLDTIVHDPRYVDSPICAHAVGTNDYNTIIRKDRFDTLKDIKFEGYDFLGFSDPHSYLTMVYGPDYMTPKKWAHNVKIYTKEDE